MQEGRRCGASLSLILQRLKPRAHRDADNTVASVEDRSTPDARMKATVHTRLPGRSLHPEEAAGETGRRSRDYQRPGLDPHKFIHRCCHAGKAIAKGCLWLTGEEVVGKMALLRKADRVLLSARHLPPQVQTQGTRHGSNSLSYSFMPAYFA